LKGEVKRWQSVVIGIGCVYTSGLKNSRYRDGERTPAGLSGGKTGRNFDLD
jgi:hypothetical protein